MTMHLPLRSTQRPAKSASADLERLVEDDFPFGEAKPSSLVIPNVLMIARVRWKLIAACTIACLMLAITYAMLTTPLFTATASILIDSRMNQNLAKQNIIGSVPLDTSMVDSQANVVLSDSIALAVIRKFDLTKDPEFVGPPSGGAGLLIYNLLSGVKTITTKLGMEEKIIDPDTLLERTAVDKFHQRLTVKREELSYVIDVSFASENPIKAAKLTNAVTDAYIKADLEAKIDATRSANQWLQKRLMELKSQATDADHKLQQYKSQNNIVETGRGLLDQQSLMNLNAQMITASAATTEAKARLDRIDAISQQSLPDSTVTDALNSAVITRLRAQYLDLASRKADLAHTVGSTHPAVAKLDDQMKTILVSIKSEEKRIADAYRNDYEIALARQESLSSSMNQLVQQAEATSQAQVKARDLESMSDAYRSIYNSFLQKHQETEQAQSIPVNESRVVSMAQTPLKKSSPKTLLALASSIILGLLGGTGLAIAREMTNDVFRTAQDVEKDLHLPCLGILPDIAGQTTGGKNAEVMTWCLTSPYSRFAETVRSIYVTSRADRHQGEAVVLGVVSAVAGEGKTTVAANLAGMAALLGERTLLIDGDMHKRSLSQKLVPGARGGLIEALSRPGALAEHVTRQAGSCLDVLPCVIDERPWNAAQLLGSVSMMDLIATAKSQYDLIIIELPPIMSVVDVRATSHLIDQFVFVLKWGETRRPVAIEALTTDTDVRKSVIGVVLNQANPTEMRSLEAYKGSKFTSYYAD